MHQRKENSDENTTRHFDVQSLVSGRPLVHDSSRSDESHSRLHEMSCDVLQTCTAKWRRGSRKPFDMLSGISY